MAGNRIFMGDKFLLKMIREAGDELLPELTATLEANAAAAMAQALADAPVGEVDTDGLPPLVTTAFREPVSIDKQTGRSNARFGFHHPMAAFIEEGVAWGIGPKERGVKPPRFLRKASVKFRKKYKADLVKALQLWLDKKLKKRGA